MTVKLNSRQKAVHAAVKRAAGDRRETTLAEVAAILPDLTEDQVVSALRVLVSADLIARKAAGHAAP